MKYVIVLFLVIIANLKLSAQILNNEFDNWVTIDTLGQPYLDLLDWNTNNVGLGSGLATQPNARIMEGNDNGVSMSSSYQGIDGLYSGEISQFINTERLINISYLSKCDSIFERGACVVNIYNQAEQLIYTDSISTPETDYTSKIIEVSLLPNLEGDLMKIEFVAFGQTGYWEPFQAYSVFNLLGVDASYTSNTSKLSLQNVKVQPNPFADRLSLGITNEAAFKEYKIYKLSGQVLLQGNELEIETKELPSGSYILELIFDHGRISEMVIKQ